MERPGIMYYIVTQSTRMQVISFLKRADAQHWMALNDPMGELFMVVHLKAH